jgi:tetratricopeptide (TPR) repeat protein
MRIAVSIFLLTALVGCGEQSAADHETLGDRAYAALDFAAALVEYRLEIVQEEDNKVLRAKAGAAALRAGDLLAAAEEYASLLRLDQEDPDAVEGLDRVANSAMVEGNREALNTALEALASGSEDLVHRKYAAEMVAGFTASTPAETALRLLPAAAAGATDARVRDSLVYEYARVMVRAGNCDGAVTVFESLVRRNRNQEISDHARTDLARCALESGNRQLLEGHPSEAVSWFERAIIGGGDSEFAVAAYIGLGEALFARGDFSEAFEAYLAVLSIAEPTDPLYRQAIDKLNDIGDAETGDEKND